MASTPLKIAVPLAVSSLSEFSSTLRSSAKALVAAGRVEPRWQLPVAVSGPADLKLPGSFKDSLSAFSRHETFYRRDDRFPCASSWQSAGGSFQLHTQSRKTGGTTVLAFSTSSGRSSDNKLNIDQTTDDSSEEAGEEAGLQEEDGEEEGLVEMNDEELALSADVEAELKALLEDREGEGADTEGGIPWRFAEADEFEDEEEEEDTEPGDGLDGGGVVFGGALWGPQVLAMAEGLLRDGHFSGLDLSIFGFRVYPDRRIVRIRLEKLTDKWGSPSVDELEAFLGALHSEVLAAEERKDLPADIEIEVSTPGAERVLLVPTDLERFAFSPMYVCYNEVVEDENAPLVKHEIFELVEVDMPGEAVVWKLADVRVNRELMGKGRRLNKKQREQRIRVPFKDLNVVRLYLDV